MVMILPKVSIVKGEKSPSPAKVLEMLIQASEYEGERVDPPRLERFWESVVGKDLASEILREIRKRREKGVA